MQQHISASIVWQEKLSIMLLGIVYCFPDSLANLFMQFLLACSKGFANIESNPCKSVLAWGT